LTDDTFVTAPSEEGVPDMFVNAAIATGASAALVENRAECLLSAEFCRMMLWRVSTSATATSVSSTSRGNGHTSERGRRVRARLREAEPATPASALRAESVSLCAGQGGRRTVGRFHDTSSSSHAARSAFLTCQRPVHRFAAQSTRTPAHCLQIYLPSKETEAPQFVPTTSGDAPASFSSSKYLGECTRLAAPTLFGS
jgi:hypothetical protein